MKKEIHFLRGVMELLKYVNTKMGTKSKMELSRGNTLPLTQLPFGMASFCPQTEIPEATPTWFFDPDSYTCQGVRLTHQPSPWIGDYGTFLFVPTRKIEPKPVSKKVEKQTLRPEFLEISWENGEEIALSPSERGCAFNVKFDGGENGYLSFFSVHGSTTFEIKENALYITNDYTKQSDAKCFKMHAIISLDGANLSGAIIENGACHIPAKENVLSGKIAISYISYDMAKLELSRIEGIEKTRQIATQVWEKYLSKIEIESENEEQKGIFYSCMYRAFLFPHTAHEIDQNGKEIHYSPFLGEVRGGARYTDYGFWDTYRTSVPLFALVARDDLKKMLEGFASDYEEGGYLPRWTSLGEVGCMPSTLIDGAIAEAVCHGVGSQELHEKLLSGMLHHATTPSKNDRYGRKCLDKYLKYGYVPYDSAHESVNLTLDFAYGDWCIATVAKKLGKDEIANEYFKRAENWKNLYDSERGLFIAKDKNGAPRESFDPFVWGYDYTESGAYQNAFGAPHALDEIAECLGGKDGAIKKLDEIFLTPPHFEYGRYGCEIHEMTEMAEAPEGLGQCAISNQPSFSLPFLYAYYGQREKSDYYVKKIATECFTRDSYPGDEDNGSMSTWYIFATLGKYPICPGSGKFTETTPLCKFKINE